MLDKRPLHHLSTSRYTPVTSFLSTRSRHASQSPRFNTILLWLCPLVTALLVFGLGASYSVDTVEAAEGTCLTLGEWQPGKQAPAYHIEGASGVVDDKLFVIGGFGNNSLQASTRVDVYNPTSNVWETAATPRRALPFKASHIQGVVDGNNIWIAGGFKGDHPGPPTDKVWRYDTSNDQWYSAPALPEPRSGGIFNRVGRFLHYAGGTSYDRDTEYADHWTLNLDNPSQGWKQAPDMPQARIHVASARVNGLLYAVGGQFKHDHDPIDLKLVHVFNPDTGVWTRKADIPVATSHAEPGTVVIDDNIVIVGGRQNQNGNGQTSDVRLYNTTSDTWKSLRSLPVPLIAPVAVVIGDKLIVTNGGYGWNIGSKDMFISQISTVDCDQPPTDSPTNAPTNTPIPSGAFVVTAPDTGDTLRFSNYTFRWTQVSGISTYKLTVKDTAKTFKVSQTVSQSACNSNTCAATLNMEGGKLPNQAALKVRVKAVSGSAQIKTPWVSFKTDMPGKAALVFPSNGGSTDDDLPQLAWMTVQRADSYKLVLRYAVTGEVLVNQRFDEDSDPSTAEICSETTCIVNLEDFAPTLMLNTLYEWRITSTSGDGSSKSEKWTFTIQKSNGASPANSELLPLP